MRVCAIDVGTNTVQSLVADVTADGHLTVVADEERFARLGQGVDASKRLAPEAMDRAVGCLRAALDTARHHGADRVVIGATSASRDATNVDVLVARLRTAGAGAPDPTPKIVRALGMRAVAPPEVAVPSDLGPSSPARDVIRAAIRREVGEEPLPDSAARFPVLHSGNREPFAERDEELLNEIGFGER